MRARGYILASREAHRGTGPSRNVSARARARDSPAENNPITCVLVFVVVLVVLVVTHGGVAQLLVAIVRLRASSAFFGPVLPDYDRKPRDRRADQESSGHRDVTPYARRRRGGNRYARVKMRGSAR